MKTMWMDLNERDKWALGIGGVILFIYLFYILLYAPLTHAVENKSKQWVEKQETLVWMKLQENKQHKPFKSDHNILAVLSKELKQSGLAPFQYQLQQVGQNHIQLSFNEVPYVDVLTWLRKITEEYAMQITELSAIRVDTSGMVKFRVVVANKG